MNRLAPQLFSLLLLASLIAPAAASASGLDDPYLDQAWQEQVSGIAALLKRDLTVTPLQKYHELLRAG